MSDIIRFEDQQYNAIAASNLNQFRPTFDLKRGAVCFHYDNEYQKEIIESSLNVIGVKKGKVVGRGETVRGKEIAVLENEDGYSTNPKGDNVINCCGMSSWKLLADAGVGFPGHEFIRSQKTGWAKG